MSEVDLSVCREGDVGTCRNGMEAVLKNIYSDAPLFKYVWEHSGGYFFTTDHTGEARHFVAGDKVDDIVRVERAGQVITTATSTPAPPAAAQGDGVEQKYPNAGPGCDLGRYRTGEIPEVGDVVRCHDDAGYECLKRIVGFEVEVTAVDDGDQVGDLCIGVHDASGRVRSIGNAGPHSGVTDWYAQRFDLIRRKAPAAPDGGEKSAPASPTQLEHLLRVAHQVVDIAEQKFERTDMRFAVVRLAKVARDVLGRGCPDVQSKPPYRAADIELAENDICPRCFGELDTGWECNSCKFDAQLLVVREKPKPGGYSCGNLPQSGDVVERSNPNVACEGGTVTSAELSERSKKWKVAFGGIHAEHTNWYAEDFRLVSRSRPSREWLLQMAVGEDASRSVSVGADLVSRAPEPAAEEGEAAAELKTYERAATFWWRAYCKAMGHEVPEATDDATAAFVRELDGMKDERDRLRKALEFYAAKDTWEDHGYENGLHWVEDFAIYSDQGKVAREALGLATPAAPSVAEPAAEEGEAFAWDENSMPVALAVDAFNSSAAPASPAKEEPAAVGGVIITGPGKYRTRKFDESQNERYIADVVAFLPANEYACEKWIGQISASVTWWNASGKAVNEMRGNDITGPVADPPETPVSPKRTMQDATWEYAMERINAVKEYGDREQLTSSKLAADALTALMTYVTAEVMKFNELAQVNVAKA